MVWTNFETLDIYADRDEKANLKAAIESGLNVDGFDGIVIHDCIPDSWFKDKNKILAIYHSFNDSNSNEYYVIKDRTIHRKIQRIINILSANVSIRRDTKLINKEKYLIYKKENAKIFAICDIVHDAKIIPYTNEEINAIKELNRIFKRFVNDDLPLIKVDRDIFVIAQRSDNLPDDVDEIKLTDEYLFVLKSGKCYKFRNKIYIPIPNFYEYSENMFDSIGIGLPWGYISEDLTILTEVFPDTNDLSKAIKQHIKELYDNIYKHKMKMLDKVFRKKIEQLERTYNNKIAELEEKINKSFKHKVSKWMDIIEYFSNKYTTIIQDRILWIRINLFPEAIKKDGKIYKLPEEYRHVYYVGWIGIPIQTKLEKAHARMYRHPNISNVGNICLGDLEEKDLTIDVINQLIEALKVVNYDSSYYDDRFMTNLLRKLEDTRENWTFSWE